MGQFPHIEGNFSPMTQSKRGLELVRPHIGDDAPAQIAADPDLAIVIAGHKCQRVAIHCFHNTDVMRHDGKRADLRTGQPPPRLEA